MIKIVIIDDHIMFRQGLKAVLELEKDIKIVGEASSGNKAMDAVKKNNPDILLVDIKLPDISGIEVCEKILNQYPNLKVIIITAFHDEKDVVKAIRAGAKGYILKDSDVKELIKQIRLVYENKSTIDSSLIDTVFKEIAKKNVDHLLSQREQEIVKLIFEGFSNDEISNKLFISTSTVKMHVHQIMTKLNVSSRTSIVREALKRELIEIN
jgi:two-component system NarL family response regulator